MRQYVGFDPDTIEFNNRAGPSSARDRKRPRKSNPTPPLEGVSLTVCIKLTHVGFIFERKLTVVAPAMEMCGPLAVKRAVRGPAFFRGPKPLESFLYYGRILSVVVGVHLHVGRAYVHFVTSALCAIIPPRKKTTKLTRVIIYV